MVQIYEKFTCIECNLQSLVNEYDLSNHNYLDDMCSAWINIDILQKLIHSLENNDHTNFSND